MKKKKCMHRSKEAVPGYQVSRQKAVGEVARCQHKGKGRIKNISQFNSILHSFKVHSKAAQEGLCLILD